MALVTKGNMTALPQRLTVETCIGCGAIGGLGDCETGCSERRLELVPASAFDRLVQLVAEQDDCLAAFLAIAEQLSHLAHVEEIEPAYRALQAQAKAALHQHPELDWADAQPEQPAEPVIAWWCPGCGAVDAPQPCLGVCIRRPAEWVNRDAYEQSRRRALARRPAERELRRLARRVASITPRAGRWQDNAAVLTNDAADLVERIACALGLTTGSPA